MNILLCDADGFLGRAIASRLESAGHQVIRAVRRPVLPGDISIDFRTDLTPDSWHPRLENIDAAINAIGILRERERDDFERIHHLAPAALFRACQKAGILRVLHISALGQEGIAPYLDSKRRADAELLRLMPANAAVLRPSLVFGPQGTSTRFFMALASLPIHAIPCGAGRLQPIHVDDVAEAALRLVEAPPAPSRILDLPGPCAMRYAEWMSTYRQLMGLPPAPHLPIPAFIMAMAARCAGGFRTSMLCRETWALMRQGSTADASNATALLGRPLCNPADFVPPETAATLRLQAFAAWRRPMLIGTLALIWLFTAIVCAGIYPVSSSLTLLQAFGLTGATASFTLTAAIGLDALMGLLTLFRPRRKLWLFQLALVSLYTLLIGWRLPEFLIHPFGPVLKNIAIAALLIQLYAEETQ
ncbi:MAG: SDR family oxidoreductase [Azoarcus sp.]|jgi:uncharacterized protein YbjT (DUF2867 family)|nr:SDR family oxidoreductase [Azoarcus sp.]